MTFHQAQTGAVLYDTLSTASPSTSVHLPLRRLQAAPMQQLRTMTGRSILTIKSPPSASRSRSPEEIFNAMREPSPLPGDGLSPMMSPQALRAGPLIAALKLLRAESSPPPSLSVSLRALPVRTQAQSPMSPPDHTDAEMETPVPSQLGDPNGAVERPSSPVLSRQPSSGESEAAASEQGTMA